MVKSTYITSKQIHVQRIISKLIQILEIVWVPTDKNCLIRKNNKYDDIRNGKGLSVFVTNVVDLFKKLLSEAELTYFYLFLPRF